MYKLILVVLALIAVASAQYISPYAYSSGLYRSAAYGAYPYNYGAYGTYGYGAYPYSAYGGLLYK